MRIGLLTTYLALGEDSDSGIGQHYRILAEALVAQGHEVQIFYLCSEETAAVARPALAALAPRWSCTLVTAPLPRWLDRACGASWPTRQLLRHLWLARAGKQAVLAEHSSRPLAIIETHSYSLPAIFLTAARHRPPILTRVSTTLGQMDAISPLRSRVQGWEARLERRVIQRSEALVTHTRQHRDAVSAFEGVDPMRFALVPHGLPDPGEPAGPATVGNDNVEFLFVGRFESRKGIDVLFQAIPQVAAACPGTRYTLAGSRGDGTEWERFAAAQASLLATGRVQALGRVSVATLAELYQRCTILVAPSRYESFGLIYAEAMACGKPVIGCDCGGIPEVVTAGVTGLLAQPGDTASLVTCMTQLASNSNLREQMGRAARADFLARFSAEVMARRSGELYQTTIARLTPNPEPGR